MSISIFLCFIDVANLISGDAKTRRVTNYFNFIFHYLCFSFLFFYKPKIFCSDAKTRRVKFYS